MSNPVHVQMFLRVVRRRVLLPQLRHRTHLIIALFPELATSLSQLSVVSSSVARDVARRKSIVTCSAHSVYAPRCNCSKRRRGNAKKKGRAWPLIVKIDR